MKNKIIIVGMMVVLLLAKCSNASCRQTRLTEVQSKRQAAMELQKEENQLMQSTMELVRRKIHGACIFPTNTGANQLESKTYYVYVSDSIVGHNMMRVEVETRASDCQLVVELNRGVDASIFDQLPNVIKSGTRVPEPIGVKSQRKSRIANTYNKHQTAADNFTFTTVSKEQARVRVGVLENNGINIRFKEIKNPLKELSMEQQLDVLDYVFRLEDVHYYTALSGDKELIKGLSNAKYAYSVVVDARSEKGNSQSVITSQRKNSQNTAIVKQEIHRYKNGRYGSKNKIICTFPRYRRTEKLAYNLFSIAHEVGHLRSSQENYNQLYRDVKNKPNNAEELATAAAYQILLPYFSKQILFRQGVLDVYGNTHHWQALAIWERSLRPKTKSV